ncbi:MAG TPA: hypothetical protein VFD70_25595 [Anaerolineae bacterium]|nr:hypothetical protein [Anaerolineae bacterium]
MPSLPPTPDQFPKTIYGIHDTEGADFLRQNNCSGWLVHSVKVWSDPSADYASLVNSGLRVLVRLNNGYGSDGTIPIPAQYDAFAQKCADWVSQSKGAKLFIIGNEMNAGFERPNNQPILPTDYANCFRKCRQAIQARVASANVIVGAIAPYNIQTNYPANPSGDWVKYFQDVLTLLQDQCDGISIHCYSRGQHPADITNSEKYPAPYQNNFKGFLAYRNFMSAIPSALRALPVYITETQPIINDAPNWLNENHGWVRAAYTEINSWNAQTSNQPIQALALFRWLKTDENWCFSNKPNVLIDFRDAISAGFQVRLPTGVQPTPPSPQPPPPQPPTPPPTTPPTPPPAGSLEQAVLNAVHQVKWMPVNNTAALWRFAKANGLQDQQTDELPITFNGEQYIVQVFNLGIVYVKVGDWGNIKVIPK